MDTIRSLLLRLVTRVDDDHGAVATEYGLTLILIALVIVGAVATFGIAVNGLFEDGASSFP